VAEEGTFAGLAKGAGKIIGVTALVGYMLYSCAVDAGLQIVRTTKFETCQDADTAAAASQRESLKAEIDGDYEKMDRELVFQSKVIYENMQCFPPDVVVDAAIHLGEVGE
jgi:hypothetical protein